MTRRPASRSLATLTAAALLGVVGCSTTPSPTNSPEPGATSAVPRGLDRFYSQQLTWSDCGGGAECTTLTVPLDYRKPGGRTIDLAVLRVLATGDRQGSLLVNPGGPGVPGTDYARNADAYFTEPVREAFDIVGWDPRGVGQSAPVDCISNAALDRLVAADGTPDNAQERTQLLRMVRNFVAGCQRNSGWELPYIGTDNSARDMDVLRSALGESQLDYFGASYGTLLGATYADQFPKRVGRLVLDGAVDPTLRSEQLGRLQAVGFERAFDAFVRDCVQREGCAVGPTLADARRQVAGLLAQADASPLSTGTSRPLTEALASTGLFSALYSQQYGWPALRLALQRALQGDGSVLLRLADLYTERQSDGTYASNLNEAFPSISCTDQPTDLRVSRIARDSRTWQRSAPLFGEGFAWGQYTCAIWPLDPKQPTSLDAKGAAPILVIGTTRDPATPYAWAVSLAGQLASGVLLTREGDGHTAYAAGNNCIDRSVEQYLVGGVVPDNGTRC